MIFLIQKYFKIKTLLSTISRFKLKNPFWERFSKCPIVYQLMRFISFMIKFKKKKLKDYYYIYWTWHYKLFDIKLRLRSLYLIQTLKIYPKLAFNGCLLPHITFFEHPFVAYCLPMSTLFWLTDFHLDYCCYVWLIKLLCFWYFSLVKNKINCLYWLKMNLKVEILQFIDTKIKSCLLNGETRI